MNREFIARLKKRAKEIAEALIGKIGSAIRKFSPSCLPAAGERAQHFADDPVENMSKNGDSAGAP
jgi:hypothetical protein